MSDQPLPTFDPERLKRERHDVDLGSDEETEHQHAATPPDAGDPLPSGVPGATPPAR